MEKNTLKKGTFRTLIYRNKKDDFFYATVLEFNLTLTSKNRDVLMLEIKQASLDYIKSANKLKNADILNQKPDSILEKIWNNFNSKRKEKVKSPYMADTTMTNSISNSV